MDKVSNKRKINETNPHFGGGFLFNNFLKWGSIKYSIYCYENQRIINNSNPVQK
jgi:hypothetical protein